MSDVQDWWRTSIIEMKPGVIRYRGYAIEQLIGRASFAQMIWLMLRGELPAAVIYAELGFPPPLARGLFRLSRSVGILAHAWEQSEQGGRNKGPLPRELLWTYDGPALRPVPDQSC